MYAFARGTRYDGVRQTGAPRQLMSALRILSAIGVTFTRTYVVRLNGTCELR